MKASLIKSLARIAAVAVFAVLGTFMFMKSALASDTVTFTQASNGSVTCTASSGSQTGSASCSDAVYNTGATGGESLSWTSVSVSPTSAWLTVSPSQSAAPIAPGSSAPVTYTVATNLSAGTYSATVTFNGQTNAPSGGVSVPADTVAVQYTVASQGGGNPTLGQPTNTTTTNTTTNSGVACNTIQLNWGAGQGADSYDVFRNGTALLTHYTGLAYTDTSVAANTSYSYTIRSYSASLGTTATEAFSPSSIQATACVVDLSLSDDLVNSVNQQPYPYNSSCIGSQTGTATVIQQFELVELRIDICNRGTVSAQNVVLTTSFDPTLYHTIGTSPWPGQTTPSSTNGGTVTWNLGTINANTNKTVFTYLYPDTGTSSSQTLQRFINSGNITYTSAGGNTGPIGCIGNYATTATPCVVSTGYVPFTTTSSASAFQQEIKP